MVDQMTIQTVGILLTGLTVSIAAIYYTLRARSVELDLSHLLRGLRTRPDECILVFYGISKISVCLKMTFWMNLTFSRMKL